MDPSMFDFEDGSCEHIPKKSRDAYDVGLGIALSESLRTEPGSQILQPEDMHTVIREKLLALLEMPPKYGEEIFANDSS